MLIQEKRFREAHNLLLKVFRGRNDLAPIPPLDLDLGQWCFEASRRFYVSSSENEDSEDDSLSGTSHEDGTDETSDATPGEEYDDEDGISNVPDVVRGRKLSLDDASPLSNRVRHNSAPP